MNFDQDYADYVDDNGVAEIKALEKELGKLIIAYPKPSIAGQMSKEQLTKLRNLEKKLCVRLVGYETYA